MTPLKLFPRGQWPDGNRFRGVKIVSPYYIYTLSKKKFGHSEQISVSAGSMTMRKPILSALASNISANTKPYAKRF
jgi:hypothetical protein